MVIDINVKPDIINNINYEKRGTKTMIDLTTDQKSFCEYHYKYFKKDILTRGSRLILSLKRRLF